MIFLEIPKINEKQRKTIKNQCFSFVFIEFDQKSSSGTIFGSKIYILSIIDFFLSNTWNTLKTSFLKCLRVCNFFFRNDVDVRNISKSIVFGFCVRIDCSTSDLNSSICEKRDGETLVSLGLRSRQPLAKCRPSTN